MKLLLTILLILFNSALFAQKKVTLFEDYRLCTTGFKSLYGTIIHEAIFSNVKDISIQLKDSKIFYYQVQFDEHVGLLNEFGTVILPWKYDYIEVLPDSNYIVSLDGKYGIVDKNDSVLLNFKYDLLESAKAYQYRNQNTFARYGYNYYSNQDEHYLFTLNNKVGLIDTLFREKIPARYESIVKTIYPNSNSTGQYDYYYQVGKNNLLGTLDSNGLEILPFKYRHIETFITVNEEDKEVHHFLLTDDQGLLSMQSVNGPTIFSGGFEQISFAFNRWENYTRRGIQSAIAKSPDSIVVYNFHSKRYVRNVLNAMPFDAFVLFENKNGWGIMDDSGDIITEGNNQVPSIFETYLQGFPDYEYNQYSYYDEIIGSRDLQSKNNIIHISHSHKFKKRHYGSQIYLSIKKLGLRGALNFRTGTKIPMKYWSISVKKDRSEPYYWAIPPYDSKNDSLVSIDIYDYSMTFLRQIQIDRRERGYDDMDEMDDYRTTQFIYSDDSDEKYSKLFICLRNNRWGAYNMKGEVVLPFEYDQIRPEYTNSGESGDPPVFYVVQKNKHFGLLNADLEIILPFEYDNLHIDNSDKLFWATKNNITTLFNYDLSVHFDPIEKLYYHPLLNFSGNTQTKDSRIVKTYYIKSHGKLYVREGRTITLMDSTRFYFSSPVISLFDEIKLNKKGQILGELDMRYQALNRHAGFYLIDKGTLKIVDENWILQLEIPGVSDVEECENNMLLLNADRSSGVVDLKKLKLRFKTDYPASVVPVENSVGYLIDYYWVLPLNDYPAGTQRKWNLVNSDGTVIDSLFEYPTVRITDVTRKNGKYGLLDDTFKPLLPYEYDFISLVRGTYLIKKDGLWGTFHKETKTLNPPNYYSISFLELSNGNRIIQEPNKIGVVDANFNVVFPLTSKDSLLENNDLFHALLGGDNSTARYFGAFETSQLPKGYRQISNENILRNISSMTTQGTILELAVTKNGSCFTENQPSNRTLNRYGNSEVNSIFIKKNNYYSEQRKTEQRGVKSNSIVITRQNSEGINYRIDGEKIEKIQLSQLFADPVNMEVVLTDLLTTIYTENQAFGLQCPNITLIIREASNNFIISPYGIRLHGKTAPKGSVFIPKESLLPFMIDQHMFD